MPYRQTEGIAQGHAKGRVPSIPDYSTISRRISRLDIKINNNNSKEFEDDYMVIAIDSTGIKITNRGQWMRDKWNVKNKNKKYVKIHVAVDVKSKKILSMKVTADEHVHDSKAVPELVDDIIKTNSMTAVGKLFADYNDIFRCLADNGIYFSIY